MSPCTRDPGLWLCRGPAVEGPSGAVQLGQRGGTAPAGPRRAKTSTVVIALTACRGPAHSHMPIQLDYDVSRERFSEALALAQSDKPLPKEWLARTRKVGESPSKTFVAVLGTALLAKATNRKVDPFSLKVRKLPTAYLARSLCKDVLVPCAVKARVHLGTTGREPFNNQPFFRHERIGPDMAVHDYVRPHLDYLCECLTAMKPLDEERSVAALAAFLRVRIEEGPRRAAPLVIERAMGVPELVESIVRFISSDPENGKRGQAVVAACLDLVFDDVKTTRVFDPSRHWPGDVVAVVGDTTTLAAEVKQRPASYTEILQFAERCAEMGVYRAIAAILDPGQTPLDADDLRQDAWRRHGVHLSILEGAGDLVHAALTWTSRPLSEALVELPQLMASRLEEIEVSAEGLAAWAALFRQSE